MTITLDNREGHMRVFGVCAGDESCNLSYVSNELTRLIDLLRVIEVRRHEGRKIDELLPQLDRLVPFFQEGHSCSSCGSRLVNMTQPTATLAPGSEDYKRAVRVNLVMEALASLQVLGKLPL